MSLNGSGVFVVNSSGQPVVSGTLITATAFNAAMQDIAAALSNALYKDGQQLNAANQAMGGFKLTGLGAGAVNGDSVRYEQAALRDGVQEQAYTRFTASGLVNALAGTLSPAIAAYAAGLRVTCTPNLANTTTTPTLNLNALGAKTIKKRDSSGTAVALAAGDYNASGPFDFEFNGTDFILLNAANSGGNLTGGLNGKLTTVASATTPDIFAVTVGNLIDYTGTATCTGFVAAPQAGAERTLVCADTAIFTAGANMLIDGFGSGQSFTAASGDKVVVRATTTTQFRLTIQRYRTEIPYVLIQEQQVSGTAGGTFTNGAQRTRLLNTKVVDSHLIATLGSNQVTLPAGTYRFRGMSSAFNVNRHVCRLQDITNTATVAVGMASLAPASQQSVSHVMGRVTITGATVFELQHICETTRATDGFGIATSLGTETYSSLEFWKAI